MAELIILQTHVDSTMEFTSLETTSATITIFGNTAIRMRPEDKKQADCHSKNSASEDESGNTKHSPDVFDIGVPIQIKIYDFLPYFYIQTDKTVDVDKLESFLVSNFTKGKVLNVEEMMRENIYGFSEGKSLYYKLSFNSPSVFRSAKSFLENGLRIDGELVRCKIFESNFPFALRFMNDMNITGMSYIRIKDFTVANEKPYVINTSYKSIEPIPLENEYIKLLPLKIMSFDIECCGSTDAFPQAILDPIIQIGNTTYRHGKDEYQQDIFCLKETNNIPGANVYSFETEMELLEAWKDFVLNEDPDIITGYNIKNFDFPYILERASILKIKDFGRLGRTEKVSKIVKRIQSSTGFGSLETSDIFLDGRLIFDLYHIFKRDYKLRSYSLNSVSVHFLGEQKEDVPYSSMHALQNCDKETRRRIASYCLKDTLLPVRLLMKLNTLVNYSELSRATHVPIDYFSTRGSSIKVLSQIYLEAGRNGYVIPDLEITNDDSTFEGAFVMEPIKGFYENPIAVLDFCSLYPSIMISKNLCYTTHLTKQQYNKIIQDQKNREDDDPQASNEPLAIETPSGNYFATERLRPGLLPTILKNLLQKRKEARAQLKQTDDLSLKAALNGRQLALKICANSIYGFTGAKVGQLPCLEISQSTTAFGREMIIKTKSIIEEDFSKTNNYTHDAQVIYGDTDSVMINFHEPDIKKVFEMSKHIAKYVSDTFDKPVSLEFEKVYSPYLLMNKKRYAGLVYMNPESADKIDTKGIETVRRDNCELVKTIINNCLDAILYRKDIAAAVDFVKTKVSELYQDKIDLSQLVISKSYTKSKYAVKSAHVELVDRLRSRGVEIRIGDRIPYVIVKGNKNSKVYERSEDPLYALENNIPIDQEYYIENQLSKPIYRLFDPIMDNISSLFQGEHTKVINTISVTGPLNTFMVKKEVCVGCKKVGSIVCEDCRLEFPKHLIGLNDDYNNKTRRFHECWRECQRCMGSIMNTVLCVNRDCPIFYMRTKVKNEIIPIKEKLDKINKLSW